MRIISGSAKGKRLARFSLPLRPTSDRLRETLFNILGPRVIGSSWLDAFGGTGAVGIEALSRGARSVIFNDREPASLKLIKKNLDLCGLKKGARLLGLDVFVLLRTVELPHLDFVFLDPPFDFGRHGKLLERLIRLPQVDRNTLILLEVHRKTPLTFLPPKLELFRTVTEGDSSLHFLQLSHDLVDSASPE